MPGALHSRHFQNDYTATGATTSLEESLVRLGLPSVHCLRVHDPNDNSLNRREESTLGWVDEVAIATDDDGCCAGLRQLRRKGIIANVGLGMNVNLEAHQGVPDEAIRMIRSAPDGTFDSALLAGGWNLLSQAGAPTFAECEKRGVSVHVAGVFASGLLVGGETYAYKRAPPEKSEAARQWRALAVEYGHELPAVAIAFAVLPKIVSRVVLGVATPEQVRQNLKWVEGAARVDVEIFREAKRRGLLAAEVPL